MKKSMLSKKIVVLGMIGIMALGQNMAMAAEEGFYVSQVAYNTINNKLVFTGSCAYDKLDSASWYMKDTVTIKSYSQGQYKQFSDSGYGINAATITISNVTSTPYACRNEGFKKSGTAYVSVGSVERAYQ